MTLEIKTINLGGVNCYLVKAGDGYILIDTGFSSKRAYLEKELESAGVMPGNLTFIISTHRCGHATSIWNCLSEPLR
jgi:hydroxyacylglutathione hydrolase